MTMATAVADRTMSRTSRFSQLLRQRRSELGLATQREAAERIGVSWRAYQDWENDNAQPRQENLGKIARGFGIPLTDLAQALVQDSLDNSRERLEDRVDALTQAMDRLKAEVERISKERKRLNGRD